MLGELAKVPSAQSREEHCPEKVAQNGGADVENGDEVSTVEMDRIYRKLDWRIIPPFWILYFLCASIRSTVGLSQTMNLAEKHDLGSVLHMTPHQISISLALFYVCYVVFDLPSNLIMTKLSPRVWMSRIVVGVGVIGSCMAAVKAAWSLYLLRLLLGIVMAGLWPGMAYYLSLFYPPTRTGKRIGFYFTAAQVSAAVVGLVSAGFQKMDGAQGIVGFRWMFLVYGLCGTITGIALLWWLPERPHPPGAEGHEPSEAEGRQKEKTSGYHKLLRWLPQTPPALIGRDAELHYYDLKRVYHRTRWQLSDLIRVLLDWRLWPLLIMYFGVVGVGIGVQSYGTVIIRSTNPQLTSVQLSLLFAPIWITDLISILMITPLSDRFHQHRALAFTLPALIQILGLLLTTYHPDPWPRYAGLLVVGFGLGPTVPITMAWTSQIFQPRHGEVGVAAASAVVSGLGNLGSIVSTYALYNGWESDRMADGRARFRKSNWVMIGMLGGSIAAAVILGLLSRIVDGKRNGRDRTEPQRA